MYVLALMYQRGLVHVCIPLIQIYVSDHVDQYQFVPSVLVDTNQLGPRYEGQLILMSEL